MDEKMTNGDWIRGMDDEQIGVTISLIVKQVVTRVHKEPYVEDEFTKVTIAWLKEEQNENGLLFKKIYPDGKKKYIWYSENDEIEPWTCKDCRQYPCREKMDDICDDFELW